MPAMASWWPWLIGVAVVIGLVVIASPPLSRRGRDRLDPTEERELDEMFARVDAETDEMASARRLLAMVEQLSARAVPLRAMQPAARSSVGRMVFADSTVLVIAPLTSEPLADGLATTVALTRAVTAGHVVVGSYESDPRGVRVVLQWASGSAGVRVIGFDQPD